MDKIKFSQLLRIGSKTVRHITGQLFGISNDGTTVNRACAVGMIIVAKAGSNNVKDLHQTEMDINTILYNTQTPVNGHHLRSYIVHLNDIQKLTPKQIADRLEELGY